MCQSKGSEELSPATVALFRESSTIRRDSRQLLDELRGFMRLTFRKLFVLLVLLCSFTVSRIVAQLSTPNGVDFKATSSFVAQNVTFPAGSYNVKPMQDDIEMLILSSSDGHSAFIPCEPLDTITPAAKTELSFHRYGSSLYLNQICVKGSTDGCLVQTGPR